MRKLSEYQGEDALDLLADILEPAIAIFTDAEFKAFVESAKEDQNTAKIIKFVLKKHKKEMIEIMAAVEGVPVEDFHVNILTLPKMALEIFNDPDLMAFFSAQLQMNG